MSTVSKQGIMISVHASPCGPQALRDHCAGRCNPPPCRSVLFLCFRCASQEAWQASTRRASCVTCCLSNADCALVFLIAALWLMPAGCETMGRAHRPKVCFEPGDEAAAVASELWEEESLQTVAQLRRKCYAEWLADRASHERT